MSATSDWWTLVANPASTRARWLGLFRRRIALTESSPLRLSVPIVGLANAERLMVPDHSALSTASCIATAPSLASPRNLIAGVERSADGERGSVGLAGVLLDDRPAVHRGPPRTTGLPARTPDTLEPQPDKSLSLAKRLAHLLQPPVDLLVSRVGPLHWPALLFDYQVDGIRALIERDALLLADDMGLGKTVQAIGALRILFLQHRVESGLIIVPASLVSQWRRELNSWAPELRVATIRGPAADRAWQWNVPAHLYLTSYETSRADFTDNPQSPPRRRVWDVVILDEAQKIKNREADVSWKCKLLRRRRAWALTGTPLENAVDDLASILEFVAPSETGDPPRRLAPGPELAELHKALQLRRKKADVLPQLPPKIVSEIVLPLGGPQRDSYDEAEMKGIIRLREAGETVQVQHVLELIMRLKQICNFCPATGRSAKLDDIHERLKNLVCEGYRALIFSQFTDRKYGVEAVGAELGSMRPLLYTGDLSHSQRDSVIREFKANPDRKVLVLSLRAGGQGLNLQDASYVFHLDRWWNPAVERQAEDWAHRLGQTGPVHVYKYTLEGTIEEKIDRILKDKQSLFDQFVDDISIDLKSKLTAEELFGLFGLMPPSQPKRTQGDPHSTPNYAGMSGVEFEQYVKKLLEGKDWRVETTPQTRDGGIDLIARRQNEVGIESTICIQCKNHASPVGVEVARALNGALPKQPPGVRGVLVCPCGFTVDAKAFANDRGLLLWDRHDLFKIAGGPLAC